MIQNKKFTNIYSAYDDYGRLNILLYNGMSKTAILFDGLSFYYKSEILPKSKGLIEIDYSLQLKDKIFEVEGIKHSWDINFIKLGNGDIFQLYFMADDKQHLSIFTKEKHSKILTPLGLNLYDSVEKSYNEAEDCEIDIEENTK